MAPRAQRPKAHFVYVAVAQAGGPGGTPGGSQAECPDGVKQSGGVLQVDVHLTACPGAGAGIVPGFRAPGPGGWRATSERR